MKIKNALIIAAAFLAMPHLPDFVSLAVALACAVAAIFVRS